MKNVIRGFIYVIMKNSYHISIFFVDIESLGIDTIEEICHEWTKYVLRIKN